MAAAAGAVFCGASDPSAETTDTWSSADSDVIGRYRAARKANAALGDALRDGAVAVAGAFPYGTLSTNGAKGTVEWSTYPGGWARIDPALPLTASVDHVLARHARWRAGLSRKMQRLTLPMEDSHGRVILQISGDSNGVLVFIDDQTFGRPHGVGWTKEVLRALGFDPKLKSYSLYPGDTPAHGVNIGVRGSIRVRADDVPRLKLAMQAAQDAAADAGPAWVAERDAAVDAALAVWA